MNDRRVGLRLFIAKVNNTARGLAQSTRHCIKSGYSYVGCRPLDSISNGCGRGLTYALDELHMRKCYEMSDMLLLLCLHTHININNGVERVE